MIVANQDGEFESSGSPRSAGAHCFFEWIYFANVASTLDDRSVYLSRSRSGEELARRTANDAAARRRHDRRAGARHRQGRRRRDGLRAGRSHRSKA